MNKILGIPAFKQDFQFDAILRFSLRYLLCCLQEPFVNIPEETIREALKVVIGTSSLHISYC